MYYIGKLAQAAGLTIILIGFIQRFPNLMDYKTLLLGVAIFLFGWIINKFFLQK